ncbi:hypothetical protein [Sphingopyxis flava]|uniref:Uncharacterized protein n=1 Tax=Sphingopyxis flava TaxID=1507287 RepID=A0A1T5BRR6_9SPHN|nr:hypothetical protein [Sphingopyxis flava]SKB49958.1 hypothetical protein SAMN06295937_100790 [Sphingopyxis flava]
MDNVIEKAPHECADVPLCPAFNQLILAIARDLMPEGWDVIPDAPDSLEELREYYVKHGRVAVNVESRHGCTVGDPEVHYAFRAWHDLIHVCNPNEAAFTLDGEKYAANAHREEIYRRLGYTPEATFFGALIEIEIVAQNAHVLRLGYWPEDPRAFALRWLHDRGFEAPRSIAA